MVNININPAVIARLEALEDFAESARAAAAEAKERASFAEGQALFARKQALWIREEIEAALARAAAAEKLREQGLRLLDEVEEDT